MSQLLHDQVAVLTGGSGTLGTAMARGLHEAGAHVFLLARSPDKLADATAALSTPERAVHAVRCDVLDEASVRAAREEVLAKGEQLTGQRRVDILVNGAGGNQAKATVMPEARFFDVDVAALRQVTDLNLTGTMLPSMVFGEAMAERTRGSIVNISSMAAQRPMTRVVGYAAAKAAVDNFTYWLAVELATKYGEGLRVNAIAPGFFIAEQNRALLTEEDGSLTGPRQHHRLADADGALRAAGGVGEYAAVAVRPGFVLRDGDRGAGGRGLLCF